MISFGLTLILWVLSLRFSAAANVYYVDKDSVRKGDYSWKMRLLMDDDLSDDDFEKLNVEIESLDRSVLRMKIVNAESRRWEVPVFNLNSRRSYRREPMSSMGIEYKDSPFEFKLTDLRSNQEFVSTYNLDSLRFFDQYLEISLRFRTQHIFGIGERVSSSFTLCAQSFLCSYVLWGIERPAPVDDGNIGCGSVYGQQPFYMLYYPDTKKFSAVFMLNSNDQDMTIKKVEKEAIITHRTIGGIFDLYFFYPGTAEEVLRKYHDLVGKPYLPPFWALGYHHSRRWWRDLNTVQTLVSRFDHENIPLDGLWAEYDYMEEYKEFTVDGKRFGGLGEFVKKLHESKIQWIPIVGPAFKADPKIKYYSLGEHYGAFIKSAFTRKSLVGLSWPGPSVFLSWYSPLASTIWKLGLKDLYDQVNFDGVWLDMNEPASFCHGECPSERSGESSISTDGNDVRGLGDPHDPHEFDDLPYKPGNCKLNEYTLSMTGHHHQMNDFEDRTLKEYNVRSLWNVFQGKVTNEFFTGTIGKRPFIMSKSNFPGSQLYSGKWLGENYSTWEYMRHSIVGIYNYQLFAMPFVGADICGYHYNTHEELCARWYQLGAFYPFSFNHNVNGTIAQEPFAFSERTTTTARNALRQKYSILQYYYTRLFEVTLNGGTLVRPLFFEFPEDEAYKRTNDMFLIGPSLLVVPALFPGQENVAAYCPNENWFDLRTGRQVYSYDSSHTHGKEITLPAGFDYTNVLVRGGSIVPYQDTLKSAMSRAQGLRFLPAEMLIAPDHEGKAAGTLFVDDMNAVDPLRSGQYFYIEMNFAMDMKKLVVKMLHDNKEGEMKFSGVTIYGAEKWKEITIACLTKEKGEKVEMSGSYKPAEKVLKFLAKPNSVNWKDIRSIEFGSKC